MALAPDPAAPPGSALFEVFTSFSTTCGAPGTGLPMPAFLGVCTPFAQPSFAVYSVQLTACGADGSVTGSVYRLNDFTPGSAETCQQNAIPFTVSPGACFSLRNSNYPFMRLLGLPSCAAPAPGSVYILETFDGSPTCNPNGFLNHQALSLGTCVAGGLLARDLRSVINVSVVPAPSGAAALRVTQFDASAGGCGAVPSSALPPIPDLALPPSPALSLGNCSADSRGGSYRLLAPRVLPTRTASPSPSPSPTVSFGSSPSASPTPSALPTPSAGSGGSASAAPLLSQTALIAVSVGATLGALLLALLACALRRLCFSRSITWSKDVDTVIVPSPMRPSIYRPTVKLPEGGSINGGSSGRRGAWGFA